MKKIIALLAVAAPSIAFAQTQAITDVNSLSKKLLDIGNTATYLLVALAVIFIIWNVVIYMVKGGSDEEARGKARSAVIWGVVGLAVIVSIWGLVNILTNTFKTTPTNQAIPNFGNNVQNGGLPANQAPVVQ